LAVLLLLGAIVVGAVIGLKLGGSLRHLSEVHFRWWGLAFLAAGLQFVPTPSSPDSRWVGAALLIASYAALIAFIALNIRLPGLWVIALGFALNMAVIGLNGGMPVSDAALRVAYSSGYAEQRRELVEGHQTKHHLERPDDVLVPLADVIPVGGPVHQVLSVGDLVWLAGTVWVVAVMTRGRRRDEEPIGDGERALGSTEAPASHPSTSS
jgi:hypothetical protein